MYTSRGRDYRQDIGGIGVFPLISDHRGKQKSGYPRDELQFLCRLLFEYGGVRKDTKLTMYVVRPSTRSSFLRRAARLRREYVGSQSVHSRDRRTRNGRTAGKLLHGKGTRTFIKPK